jgi:hypothetical protein
MQPRRLRSSQIAGLPPFTTFHDTGGPHLRRRPPPECYSHKLKSLRYGDGGGVPPVEEISIGTERRSVVSERLFGRSEFYQRRRAFVRERRVLYRPWREFYRNRTRF